jgi:four helix bundle protein
MNAEELANRFVDFSAEIIRVCGAFCSDYTGKHIYGQLLRSATSAGANYEEARGAESKADFNHKLQVVLKEIRESRYWLILIEKTKRLPENNLSPLINEVNEVVSIITKSVKTAKSKISNLKSQI